MPYQSRIFANGRLTTWVPAFPMNGPAGTFEP